MEVYIPFQYGSQLLHQLHMLLLLVFGMRVWLMRPILHFVGPCPLVFLLHLVVGLLVCVQLVLLARVIKFHSLSLVFRQPAPWI